MDGTQFEKGFREFVDRVFPEPEYQLRLAGPERLARRDSLPQHFLLAEPVLHGDDLGPFGGNHRGSVAQ